MDETFLPASAYNLIPLATQQIYSIPPYELEQLAHIFISFQVHHYWGIGILHRHADVPDMHIMVHETGSHHVDECRSQDVTCLYNSQIEPNSLYLNSDGKFQAYEYESRRSGRPPIDREFLHCLQKRLTERRLHKALALVARPRSGLEQATETLIQSQHGDIIGTRSVGIDVPHGSLDDGEGLITSWTFDSKPSGVEVVAVKSCRTLPTGLHEVHKDNLDI